MRCPKCGKDSDKVIETRMGKEGDTVRRRRECLECHCRFTTYETILPSETVVLKKDGRREEYKPEKILMGIKQACWKRKVSLEVIDNMVSNITAKVSELQNSLGEIESHTIGELAMDELRLVDEVAYVRFASVYRHFKDAEAFIDVIQKLPSQASDGGSSE